MPRKNVIMQKELTRARIQALISSVFYRFGGVRSLQPLAQRQNVFQPGNDAFLLGKGREGDDHVAHLPRTNMGDTDSSCLSFDRVFEQI